MSGAYKPSIVAKEDRCFGCGRKVRLEVHHCFGGSNRKNCTEDGLVVMLCADCHRHNLHGVHGLNKELDIKIKRTAEEAWLDENNKTIEVFIKRYGRNYL